MAIKFNLGEDASKFVEKLNELSEEAANNINPNEISAGVTSTNTLSAGSSSTASASWDEANKKINFTFGIPKGGKGDAGTPTFVNSVEEMVDTSKSYVLLPEGYIYSASVMKAYTNQVPISIDTNGSIFNGKGWIERTRLSSTGVTKANDFTSATGYMPALSGAIVRIKATAWDNGADYICTYNSSFGFLTALSGQGAYGGGEIISRDGGVTTIRLPSNNNIALFKFVNYHYYHSF